MDREDLAARQRKLYGPLKLALDEFAPAVGFVVDVDEATVRPGAPVAVSWTDGPTPEAVARLLAPRWATGPEAGGREAGGREAHTYPVTLERTLSPVAAAAAIVSLWDANQLTMAVYAGRHGFGDVLARWSGSRTLPQDVPSALLPQAELLADISRTTSRCDDPFVWATWLVGDGRHILTHVLPGALNETRPAERARPTTGVRAFLAAPLARFLGQ